MTSPTAPLPTFLIIGAQKSATRWLRSNLGEHPDVFAAPIEISYFNQRYSRGTEFYRSQFRGWNGEPIVGEATPGYMMWRHKPERVAQRIKETVPDVRLLVLLRNPIDRAQSAMVHHMTKERLAKRSKLVDLITRGDPEADRLGLVTGGWYAASLAPYFELFGDQLLVLLHDEVADDPLGVYRRSLAHIGAEPGFVPVELDKIVYSNQKGRLRRDKDKAKISQADREILWPYFADDVQRLERMSHRDLAAWNPTAEAPTFPPVPDNVFELHERASEWVQGLIERVTDDQLGDPTPCPDWDVQQLLDHVLVMARLLSAVIARYGLVDMTDVVAPAGDVDRGAAYGAAIEAINKSVSESSSLTDIVEVGPRLPVAHHLLRHLVYQVAHGWDLAVATGQDPTIPDELVEPATKVVDVVLSLLDAPEAEFAAEVALPPDASATDRFVALLGRNPAVLASS